MAAGVTLNTNLRGILGGTILGYVRVTLCGIGPYVPAIAGTGMVADAGIPRLAGPGSAITLTLWGNDQITPDSTFYCVEVLDENEDVIQAGNYQFLTGDSPYDLSTAEQIIDPYGFSLPDLAFRPCTGAIPGEVFVAPGRIVALAYNGVLLREGLSTPNLSYVVTGQDFTTAVLNFNTETEDRIDAICIL